MFDLPHAETHAVLLPHTMAYNAPAAADAVERLTRALNSRDAVRGLYDLARALGAATTLRELGMPADGIGHAVEEALASPYWNPRPLEKAGLTRLLENAWGGAEPLPS